MASRDRVSYLDFGRRGPTRPSQGPAPPKREARPELIARFERSVGGRYEDAPGGYRLIGRRVHDLEETYGPCRLGDLLGLPARALAWLARDEGLTAAGLRGLAFVDCETTGLAGGTGTKAFLIGIARFDGEALAVEQHFLPDYDLEPAFLDGVAAGLASASALVTFNGKCFDLPLLETRFALARRRADWLDLPHLDLLHPARRLWRRRLASCALTSLEEQVLGVQREADVPGWLIPSLYFRFLRTGDFAPLEVVFEHNRRDLLGLAALTVHLARLLEGEVRPASGIDLYSLARYLEDLGDLDRSVAYYRQALALDLPAADLAEARARLAFLLRRLGDGPAAVAEWEALARLDESRALQALVELAKHFEHRARDLPLALEATRRALLLARVGAEASSGIETTSEALERRLWRLEARAAGAWRRKPVGG